MKPRAILLLGSLVLNAALLAVYLRSVPAPSEAAGDPASATGRAASAGSTGTSKAPRPKPPAA